MKPIKSKEVYTFKKGQVLHLDQIYLIQGLCDGDWYDQDIDGEDAGESVIINRDITIEIIEK